jgi:hypothetical protein
MPYRAPELFDVKTGKMLDEKVDIWVRIRVALADGSLWDVPCLLSRMVIPHLKRMGRLSPWQSGVGDINSLRDTRTSSKD